MSFKYVNLEDICLKITDGTHKTPNYVESGIPFLRVTDIQQKEIDWKNTKFISTEEHKELIKRCHTEPGDILFSKNGTIGKVKVVSWKKEFSTFVSLATIKPDHKKVMSNFLAYFLSSPLTIMQTSSKSQTGTVTNLHLNKIKKIQIPLPPMETQKKIVNILDKAQELIDKRKQQIDLMDSLVQSLFYDMFGDPVLNPMGWEEKNISEIIKEKTQNGLYLSQEHYSSEGIQMVHMSDAFYDMVPLGEMKRVKLNSNDITKYKLEPNDLILARRSLNYEGAAKPCRVPKTISESIVYESSLIRLRPDNSKILTIYLYYYLKDERIRKAFIYKHITKSTISGINNKALNMIKIINPPITLQNKFAEKVEKIETQKQKMQKSLKDLEQNFSSLMQRAFKGEI